MMNPALILMRRDGRAEWHNSMKWNVNIRNLTKKAKKEMKREVV
jgi:hypothetical protein